MSSTRSALSVSKSKMISTCCVSIALLSLFEKHSTVAADVHMTNVAAPHTCVTVTPGEIRPKFGCFRIGIAKNIKFSDPAVFWHLQTYPSLAAANAAKSSSGIVVEEDGRVWLSEFGSKDRAPRGGHHVAALGPLRILAPTNTHSPTPHPPTPPRAHSPL